jgi:hypothetical protein
MHASIKNLSFSSAGSLYAQKMPKKDLFAHASQYFTQPDRASCTGGPAEEVGLGTRYSDLEATAATRDP